MVDLYGNGNGFGWMHGDVIGAQIVSVPMTLALTRANHSLLAFVAALSAVFLVMLVALNVLMHFFILKPMQRITSLARDVSAGKPDVPEYTVKGKDEIASLGRSFNLMHRSLQNAMRMLETNDDASAQGPDHGTDSRPNRPIRRRKPGRRGRHGPDLQGPRPRHPPHGGHQADLDAADEQRRPQRIHTALPPRSRGRRALRPSEHRLDLRLRHCTKDSRSWPWSSSTA